ncbi:MAG: heme exporter protein CcmB [Gammaproteobacteria bacterium]|nr:heme exporter protein CcmB [Gammaproteobacteria bacterium]
MNAFVIAFNRTMRVGWRHPLDSLNPMAFFIIVTSLISITVEGESLTTGNSLAVAVLWVVLLLSTMMASGSAYAQDYEDGSLEQMVAQNQSLYASVHGSVAARWFLSAVPIVALVPLGAWMLDLDTEVWWILFMTLIPGSIVFTLFGVLGATLTLGVGRNGVLLALLVLPLYVPVLLLGVGACQRSVNQEPFEFALIGIYAIAMAAITFLPFAIAALLRVSQEY